jgi:hypothetical protein
MAEGRCREASQDLWTRPDVGVEIADPD